ncbi:Uncharacterized protein Adt_22137 [Abeliophyllum distichum]|uniref:LAGLIDADG homing endonuclease n=1 Tax=Abeliophyllum distichum TaxID=126358 RepID=A0ABD1T1J8_9LAMI
MDKDISDLGLVYSTLADKIDSSDKVLKNNVISGTEVGSGDLENRNTNNHRECGEGRAYTKLSKIDFPVFGGGNPREWVKKANKYFQLHQIPDEMKMGIVEMYLNGKADI